MLYFSVRGLPRGHPDPGRVRVHQEPEVLHRGAEGPAPQGSQARPILSGPGAQTRVPTTTGS